MKERVDEEKKKPSERHENYQNIDGQLRAVLVAELIKRNILDLDWLELTRNSTWFDEQKNMNITMNRIHDGKPRYCLTQAIVDQVEVSKTDSRDLKKIWDVCQKAGGQKSKIEFQIVCLDSLIRKEELWEILLGSRLETKSKADVRELIGYLLYETCMNETAQKREYTDKILQKVKGALSSRLGMIKFFRSLYEDDEKTEMKLKKMFLHAMKYDTQENIKEDDNYKAILKSLAAKPFDEYNKLIRSHTNTLSDDLCAGVLDTLFRESDNLDVRYNRKYQLENDFPGEDKPFYKTSFHPRFHNGEEEEKRRERQAIWQDIFINEWPDLVKELQQDSKIKKMKKSYKRIRAQIMFAFGGERHTTYYFNKYIDFDTRLSALDTIKEDWVSPFGITYVAKRFFSSMAFFGILLGILDLATDVIVVQKYYHQARNSSLIRNLTVDIPQPEMRVDLASDAVAVLDFCRQAIDDSLILNLSVKFSQLEIEEFPLPHLDELTKVVPRWSYFGFSLASLVAPLLIEWLTYLYHKSALLYLSQLAWYCCTKTARFANPVVFIPTTIIAALIQPVGTKLWDFYSHSRLVHVRESKGKTMEVQVKPDEEDKHQCDIRNGDGDRISEKDCENVCVNSTYMLAKTRLMTTAIESTYMPLLQMYAEFPSIVYLFHSVDNSSILFFLKSLFENEALFLSFVSITGSIIGMAWQHTMLHFSQSSRQENQNSRLMFWCYFSKTLLQVVSRILALTVASISLGTVLPPSLHVVPPPIWSALAIVVIQFVYLAVIEKICREGRPRWLEVLTNAFSSIVVLRAKTFNEKVAYFWSESNPKPGDDAVENSRQKTETNTGQGTEASKGSEKYKEAFGDKTYRKVGLWNHYQFALFTLLLLLPWPVSLSFENKWTAQEENSIWACFGVAFVSQLISLQLKIAHEFFIDPWGEYHNKERKERAHKGFLGISIILELAGALFLSYWFWETGRAATIVVGLLILACGYGWVVQKCFPPKRKIQ